MFNDLIHKKTVYISDKKMFATVTNLNKFESFYLFMTLKHDL